MNCLKHKRDGDLRSLFKKNIESVQWSDVESGAVTPGIPDSEYCSPEGISGWVEYKKTENCKVTFQRGQPRWLSTRARMGGRVFIAVRRARDATQRNPPMDELWLVHGRGVAIMEEKGLLAVKERDIVGIWKGGPQLWDWGEIEDCLRDWESSVSYRRRERINAQGHKDELSA